MSFNTSRGERERERGRERERERALHDDDDGVDPGNKKVESGERGDFSTDGRELSSIGSLYDDHSDDRGKMEKVYQKER